MKKLLILGIGIAVLLPILVIAVILVGVAQATCGNGTPTGVTTVAGDPQTMGLDTRYLEAEGIPAVAAAGIIGNLEQESTLNPLEPGGAIAQWTGTRLTDMISWVTAHMGPGAASTTAGQLTYIANQITKGVDGNTFYSGTASDLNKAIAANSPQMAALYWMNDYEECLYSSPTPGTTALGNPLGATQGCDADARQSYALQAYQAAGGKSAVSVALLTPTTPGGACTTTYGLTGSIKGYTNPLEKATNVVWERTDQGVDASMAPGSPIVAFAPSQMMFIEPDWYDGEPALVFKITSGPLAGKWWYLAEQVIPTVSPQQTVAAGQVVATYAPSGTGIEIGWWTPNGNIQLAQTMGGYSGSGPTVAGADFRYLLQALGANPGNPGGGSMGNSYYP